MRGRTKLLSLVAVFAVLLTSSLVFASGLVDVSKTSLFGGSVFEPESPGTPNVFFDDDTISGDYYDPGFAIGDTFQVSVNVSDVTDLFTYQINITWNPSILNFTRLVGYGDLLDGTISPYGTSRIAPTLIASNETGYASIAETILGDYPGITDLIGGRLFTIEFEIVGYGWTELNVGASGTLPTLLLDSTGATSSFTSDEGWFDNRIRGDSDGNGVVSVGDRGVVSDNWGSTTAKFCDWDFSGVISIGDRGIVSDNWGRT